MRHALLLAPVVFLAACGPTNAPSRSSLGWDYPFQRPVTGTRGTVLPITDLHWIACDEEADRQARMDSAQRRTAYYSFMRVGLLDLLTFGTITDSLMAEELAKPEPPEETVHRQQTYERLMRSCLVNHGYAIRVPPTPNQSFGARP